jgi:hypothetical protein
MAKLLKLLKNHPLILIVNLPFNSPEFAVAAEGAGADAISLTIASFEQYAEQKEDIFRILKQVKVPVGVMLNSTQSFKVAELNKLVAGGVDFIGVSVRKVPKALGNQKSIAQVFVLDNDYTIDEIMNVEKKDNIILEAATARHPEIGAALNVGDLQNYITMATSTDLPIVVQAQKRICTSEIPIIWDTGVKGLEITAVLTGETTRSLQKVVKEYRLAIDDLGEE